MGIQGGAEIILVSFHSARLIQMEQRLAKSWLPIHVCCTLRWLAPRG